MVNRIIISLLLIFSFATNVSAEVTFKVNAPARAYVGDKIYITFELKNADASPSSLKVPQINGCTLLYGPTTATSQSYQIYQGQQTSSSTIEFTYTYRADKEGTFTIGSASISANGTRMTTKPVTITILPSNRQNSNSQNQRNQNQVFVDDVASQSVDKNISSNDVFIRISTSKSTAYEQEAIECTIKLYTKYSITEFIPLTQPTFNGYLVEDLPIQSSLNTFETVNGQEYRTALIKKCILFPQKSGKLSIVSGTYDLTVVQYEQVYMGFYTVSQPQTKRIKVNSNSASVNVLPLPSPQPAGFNGAVGKFNVVTRMSTNTFRTNEPATLLYTVSGTGNIKYLKDPEIDFPSEFEQYSPRHDVDAKVQGNNVTGKSVTEFTFVPQETGSFSVNVPDFVYFDPNTKEYVTVKCPSYDVKVARGVSSGSSKRQDVAVKNSDIFFIHTNNTTLNKSNDYLISSIGYWCAIIAIIIILLLVIKISNQRQKTLSDIVGVKKSKANKVARRRLHLANKYLNSDKSDKFYEEILKALWGYFSDKLSIPVSELSRNSIEQQLLDKGVDQDTADRVIALLDKCEMARYTPSESPQENMDIYNEASEIIHLIEKSKINK